MALAYYNEHDPFAAAWLRNLIAAGRIAPGDVDERDIRDVVPTELVRYTQCHFFAGIGVWSLALRLAGWPDERPVWTGSCPCQPFSAAGAGAGFDDERHLWPAWQHLIRFNRPDTILGEQVASADGLSWLDLVYSDLEGEGYACGAVDLCAAGVGAPHIRQRLWFVGLADAESGGSGAGLCDSGSEKLGRDQLADGECAHGLVDSIGAGLEGHGRGPAAAGGRIGAVRPASEAGEPCGLADQLGDGRGASGNGDHRRNDRPQLDADERDACRLADASDRQLSEQGWRQEGRNGTGSASQNHPRSTGRPGPTNGFWGAADWLFCRDGKWRPVESGTFPLAHGIAGRVGQLRAYGNAISPWPAKEFIESVMELMP